MTTDGEAANGEAANGEAANGEAAIDAGALARLELILGGQRSGKSRLAEGRGLAWLAADSSHRVSLVATALAADDEMAERIARHRAQRPAAFATVEAPWQLAATLHDDDEPAHLRIVDCLTLWLTNWLLPAPTIEPPGAWPAQRQALLDALAGCRGPVVLVSNEIGMGMIPLGREARRFVDELGGLHRDVGRIADRVTLVVAGLELAVKR